MLEIIQRFDTLILEFINTIHNSVLDNIMVFITRLGDAGFIWIVIGILLIISKKYRKVGLILALALIIQSILGEGVIKNIVQRDRPFLIMENIELLIKAPTSFSFPSGHTAASITSGIVLVYFFGKKGLPFLLLGLLIAFSRIYLLVHYPSDVIGGVLLGCFSAYVAIVVGKRYKVEKIKNN